MGLAGDHLRVTHGAYDPSRRLHSLQHGVYILLFILHAVIIFLQNHQLWRNTERLIQSLLLYQCIYTMQAHISTLLITWWENKTVHADVTLCYELLLNLLKRWQFVIFLVCGVHLRSEHTHRSRSSCTPRYVSYLCVLPHAQTQGSTTTNGWIFTSTHQWRTSIYKHLIWTH